MDEEDWLDLLKFTLYAIVIAGAVYLLRDDPALRAVW